MRIAEALSTAVNHALKVIGDQITQDTVPKRRKKARSSYRREIRRLALCVHLFCQEHAGM